MLLAVATAWPQSAVKIRGIVVDAASGEPLPGANVQASGTAFGAATGANGRFEIESLLNGEYILRISFIGYEAQEKRVLVRDDEPAFVLARLQPTVIRLRGVEVAGERQQHGNADGAVLLTRENIERAQVDNLGELLKSVGGLQVVDDGGKKTIQIRGARANQTLVLLDGVKLNDPITGEVDLSQTPLHNVESVEIIKGGAAEYGDGALGGLIRITTLKGGAAQQTISGGAGSFGYRSIQAGMNRQWRTFDLTAGGQEIDDDRRFSYRYFNPTAVELSSQRQNADVHSRSLYARLGYAAGDHAAALKLQSYSSDRGTPGQVFYWTPYARIESQRRAVLFNYDFNRRQWRLRADGGRTWQATENKNLRPEIEQSPFGSTPEFHFKSRLQSDDLNLLLQHLTAPWLRTALGVEIRQLRYRDENLYVVNSSAIGDARDRSFGLFIKQEYSYRRNELRFAATPILRYDAATLVSESNRRYENQLNPGLRLFLSRGSQRQFYLRAEADRAFRMPTFADLFYQDFRVQGKADLAPEKSRNLECAVGARWFGFLNAHFDAAFFQNKIEDMIFWRLGSFEFFRPYNTDAELRGGEYSLQLSTPSNRLGLELFYSHLKALNKNDNQTLHDKMLPYRPGNSYKVNLHFSGEQWGGSAALRGVGRRFITEANTKAMPPYTVLDVNAEWSMRLRFVDLQWRLAVFNVLDERYEILRDMPLPGREWRFGLAIKVKAGS